MKNERRILGGGLYAAGRAAAYIFIGYLLVKSLLSAPSISFFMQKYGSHAPSPVLVLAGMYMLGLFGRDFEGFNIFDVSKFKARKRTLSSLLMGFAFALAFCPIAAASISASSSLCPRSTLRRSSCRSCSDLEPRCRSSAWP